MEIYRSAPQTKESQSHAVLSRFHLSQLSGLPVERSRSQSSFVKPFEGGHSDAQELVTAPKSDKDNHYCCDAFVVDGAQVCRKHCRG